MKCPECSMDVAVASNGSPQSRYVKPHEVAGKVCQASWLPVQVA